MSKPIIAGPYRTFRDLNSRETFVEYEGSTITIPIQGRTPGGEWVEERLKLSAFMRLEVFPAYVNGLGTREFQFIIRDWELYGYSPLLNQLFMGDERGYLAPDADPRAGREQAVMTFTVAHHYEKHDDGDNENLAPTSDLEIRDITHHDTDDGDLYWQVEDDGGKGFTVRFHRRPPDEAGIARILEVQDFDDVIAEASGLEPGDAFIAEPTGVRAEVPAPGNTVLSRALRLRAPASIRWRLGRNPQPGAAGRLHVVSPPKSLCVADSRPMPGEPIDSSDFPARITYAASYDVYVNDTRFVEDQAGIAIAVGVDRIPPVDVLVAFEKPHAGEVLGRFLKFGPGCCTGMLEISERDFRGGCDIARYWRTAWLDVQSAEKPPGPPRVGGDNSV